MMQCWHADGIVALHTEGIASTSAVQLNKVLLGNII